MSKKDSAIPQSPSIQAKKTVYRKRKKKGIILSFLLPILLLIGWNTITVTGIIPTYQLPTPQSVLERIVKMAQDGSLWAHLGTTTLRVLIGCFIGTVAAVILGSIVGFYQKAERIFDPIIQAFKAIPSLAWVPLFILWMGIGEPSKITLIAVGVFFPVYLNMVSGILNVDQKLIEIGKIYRLTHFQLVRRIIFPAAAPSFFVGLRSGLGLGWMFVVAAELMGASEGLGYLLIVGQNTSSPDIIIASILLFALIGKLTDWVIKLTENKLLKWRDSRV